MALPLPRVVPDVGPGGPLVTSMRGINALTNSNLENQYAGIRNQYAPYNMYANALSKIAYAQYLPYQLQAQALSNPLLWMAMKDNPQAAADMMNRFASSMPQGNTIGQLPGGQPIPVPGQRGTGNGLLSMLINRITGGDSQPQPQSRNALTGGGQEFGAVNQASPEMVADIAEHGNAAYQNQPQSSTSAQGSALIPATQGGIQGIIGSKIAPFYAQSQKPGTAFVDPNSGNIISTPTNETVTAAQNAINAAKRVEPQLEKLADAAGPFLSAGGIVGNQFQRGWNLVFPNKAGKLPTQYAQFNSLLQSAPEALVKSYGLRPTNETIDRMQKVIEPYMGETKEQYKARILNQLEALRTEQIGVSQQQLSQGFNLGGGQQSAPSLPIETPVKSSSKISSGAKNLAKDMQLPQFESKEQFQAWYARQPKMVQDAVREHLGKK